MAKKKKKQELQEDERYENYFEVFMRNYRNVPGFKALMKIVLFFVLVSIMMLITYLGKSSERELKSTTTTTTTTKVTDVNENSVVNYKDALEILMKNNHEVSMVIQNNDTKYQINYSIQDNIIDGYLETVAGTHHFKIQNDIVYEINLNEEKENPNLLNEFNINYFDTTKLINSLKNEIATKQLNNDKMIYHYIIDSINYYVILDNNQINNIQIKTDKYEYDISYK